MRSVNREITPEGMAPPGAAYAHAVLSDHPGRLLHTSGVVPVRADGTVPDTLSAQVDVVWANLAQILGASGMGTGDIVAITTYVVVGEDLAVVTAARDRALRGHRAASTLVTVPALARREWRMEVAIVAATP